MMRRKEDCYDKGKTLFRTTGSTSSFAATDGETHRRTSIFVAVARSAVRAYTAYIYILFHTE